MAGFFIVAGKRIPSVLFTRLTFDSVLVTAMDAATKRKVKSEERNSRDEAVREADERTRRVRSRAPREGSRQGGSYGASARAVRVSQGIVRQRGAKGDGEKAQEKKGE